MSQEEHALFVYGTLLSGHPQAHLLGGAARILGTTLGGLYSLPAGYPALTPAGRDLVHGEFIATFDRRILPMLDQYEGVGEGLYQRQLVPVRYRMLGAPVDDVAWAYVMEAPWKRGGRRLPSGRWKTLRRR